MQRTSRTVQEREFELGKLLLRDGDAHLGVRVLSVVEAPPAIVLARFALDVRLKRRRHSIVQQAVQAFVDGTSGRGRRRSGATESGTGSRRGGPEQVEKVQLSGEWDGAVEDGDMLDQGEGGGLRRRIRERGRERVRERVARVVCRGGTPKIQLNALGTDLIRISGLD